MEREQQGMEEEGEQEKTRGFQESGCRYIDERDPRKELCIKEERIHIH